MTASKYVIGVPKEIKTDEYRVAMIPVGVEELTRCGHKVLIQVGAGQGSGIQICDQFAGRDRPCIRHQTGDGRVKQMLMIVHQRLRRRADCGEGQE